MLICGQMLSLTCLVRSFISVGVVLFALGVVTGHTAGSPGHVTLPPVLMQPSVTSSRFGRPFLSSFSGDWTNMTGNASLIGLQSLLAVGS